MNANNYFMPYVIEQGPNGERGYDLLSRLLKERIIYLFGPVEDNMATMITGQLLFLQAESETDPITMYINSPGGAVTAGMAIIDTMKIVKPIVNTVCVGQAASMGALILCSGEKGHRKALSHSRIMIHQPLGGAEGQASDIEIRAKEIIRIRDEIVELMVKETGRKADEILHDIDRDNFMTAKEAMNYGLIDSIIKEQKKK